MLSIPPQSLRNLAKQSEVTFYRVTIPVFTSRVVQLRHCLEKAEIWCKESNKPTSTLVEARLVEDMNPLPFQVQTVYRMLCYFFTKMDLPGAPDSTKIPVEDSFEKMLKQVDEILHLLNTVDQKMLEGKAEKDVEFGPPGSKSPWRFTGLLFFQQFILVNVMFHTATAYGIMRKEGVPLGKLDYLGPVGIDRNDTAIGHGQQEKEP